MAGQQTNGGGVYLGFQGRLGTARQQRHPATAGAGGGMSGRRVGRRRRRQIFRRQPEHRGDTAVQAWPNRPAKGRAKEAASKAKRKRPG